MCFGLIKKAKIEEAKFVEYVKRCSKSDECLICGKKLTSPHNSHVVPQFILREIAENGYVSYGHALHKIDVAGVKKTTGIKNAYLFRLICSTCDREYFKHYENPDNLFNYNNLSENDRKIMLCEMALKTHLSHIGMKYENLIRKDVASGGQLSLLEKEGVFSPERIDIDEHLMYVSKLKRLMKSDKNPFLVLYNRELNYKTKIATQTIINFNFDLDGNQIFNPNLLVYSNQCSYFYLMILPYKGKTQVLFYIEKDFSDSAKAIVEGFRLLSEEEKLHFLFISLIIHDQQFYMSPSFAKTILKKDKSIRNLYTSTDVSGGKNITCQRKIVDFRKYKNYLLKENNIWTK